jgi:hypothetical protein
VPAAAASAAGQPAEIDADLRGVGTAGEELVGDVSMRVDERTAVAVTSGIASGPPGAPGEIAGQGEGGGDANDALMQVEAAGAGADDDVFGLGSGNLSTGDSLPAGRPAPGSQTAPEALSGFSEVPILPPVEASNAESAATDLDAPGVRVDAAAGQPTAASFVAPALVYSPSDVLDDVPPPAEAPVAGRAGGAHEGRETAEPAPGKFAPPGVNAEEMRLAEDAACGPIVADERGVHTAGVPLSATRTAADTGPSDAPFASPPPGMKVAEPGPVDTLMLPSVPGTDASPSARAGDEYSRAADGAGGGTFP